ncbi:MAG: thiamine pyrophosphate-binding protein [Eubacterium sp.]|nr:thiamine pyrophosphate-binding protein [Eubacterium sp.]
MKIRLADYIADFLTERGITDCFTVTGGGAMHLNDAFGHHPKLHCTYNHHEQASAIAAEAYARLTNRMALLCVTTGPGGTNALTGVLGGWLDSIPMFVVSGQVRYDTTARYNARFTGEPLRSVGDQEFDITKAAGAMCKYAAMVEDPKDIRYHLERAWYMAVTGRPGPVWLDVPVNFQGCMIETEELRGYDAFEQARDQEAMGLPEPFDTVVAEDVLEQLCRAKRPVIYAGTGIRLAGAMEEFRKAVDLLGVPVCTYWDAIDLIETDHPFYVGRGGNMGDRPGNFAVQNSDLVLAIGNRLPIRVTGYNWETWARDAKVIMVDIDAGEMKKPAIHVDQAIHADARVFLSELLEAAEKYEEIEICESVEAEEATGAGVIAGDTAWDASAGAGNSFRGKLSDIHADWVEICQNWKKKYPVVTEQQKAENVPANPYAVFDIISRALPAGITTITSNGTCCVAGHQSWVIKEGSRFLNNNAVTSMGYGLPAAIGAAVAEQEHGQEQNQDRGQEQDRNQNQHPYVICLEGDGSIMMNLQELQTIVTNRLPVKIVLINNQGYHSIRQTQGNLFSEHTKVGIGPESGDLGFPDFEKLAGAFSLPYVRIEGNRELEQRIGEILGETEEEERRPLLCEVMVDINQRFEPKSSTRRNPDGTLESPPLEDLAPFLPREELAEIMAVSKS